jgi:hypothetical protein
MYEFVEALESVETAAEYMHQILTQTLFLFPLDDIINRLAQGKSESFVRAVSFIHRRISELNLATYDKFKAISNPQQFTRIITFLPKASIVRKFLDCLYYHVGPTFSTSTASSSSDSGSSYLNNLGMMASSLSQLPLTGVSQQQQQQLWRSLSLPLQFQPSFASSSLGLPQHPDRTQNVAALPAFPQLSLPLDWTANRSQYLFGSSSTTAGSGTSGLNNSLLSPPWIHPSRDFRTSSFGSAVAANAPTASISGNHSRGPGNGSAKI